MSNAICLDGENRPIDHGDCIVCRRSEYNLTNPVPLTHLSQFSQSSDCGYFAGFVLSKLYTDSDNLFSLRVSRHQVYAARERYLAHSNRQTICWHRHNLDLREVAAAEFLRSLNVLGYRVIPLQGTPSADPSGYHYRLLEMLGYRRQHISWRYGLMLATTQGNGHWVVILRVRDYSPRVRTPQSSFLVYDSSGVRGTQDNLAWVSASEFAQNYTRTIQYAVGHYQ
jgi:hypothetical protein